MRALRLTGIGQMDIVQVADPVPGPGEAVVAVKAAALNHRDVWILAGQYAGVKYPCIPGSDGAGVVIGVGKGAEPEWIGREVVINPGFDWGPDPKAQGPDFSILGLPRQGTFAERIAVPVTQLTPKPAHLGWEEAAALPLAGLTAWRALIARGGFSPLDRILITGIGSGVALFVLQFAVAHSAEVWVTSSAEEKIDRAVKLGARGGFLYTDPDWARVAAAKVGGFDLIVDSAGGPGFNALIDAAAPGGRIVFFGATRGNAPEVVLRKIFWRQLSLLGTTMGGPDDWLAMAEFIGKSELRPVISRVYPFADVKQAFDLMDRGAQFGKIVLQISAPDR